MNKILKKILDRFLGIIFTLGIAMVFWIIVRIPEINEKNTIFVLISCTVPWLINFVFGYSSKLYMKGLLHGILWFVIEMIVFNLMYGVALEALVLLRCAVIYAAIYSAVLFLFYKASSKLNIPVRHVAEFFGKLMATIK